LAFIIQFFWKTLVLTVATPDFHTSTGGNSKPNSMLNSRSLNSIIFWYHLSIYESKIFFFWAHSLTMVLRQFVVYKISLEYCGKKKVMILLLWEIFLNTNFQKCFEILNTFTSVSDTILSSLLDSWTFLC
jgi:hypothetical protein